MVFSPGFKERRNKEEDWHVLLMLLAFITQQDKVERKGPMVTL